MGFEFAFGIPIKNIWAKRQTDSTFYHLYKLRATAKHYTAKNFYIGFEIFFIHNRYKSVRSILLQEKKSNLYYSKVFYLICIHENKFI